MIEMVDHIGSLIVSLMLTGTGCLLALALGFVWLGGREWTCALVDMASSSCDCEGECDIAVTPTDGP